MTRKRNPDAAFNRRVKALPKGVREGSNMWLSYIIEARRWRALSGGRAAYFLDGAAQCRTALASRHV